jgi:putative heme-binding domain-containing protein
MIFSRLPFCTCQSSRRIIHDFFGNGMNKKIVRRWASVWLWGVASIFLTCGIALAAQANAAQANAAQANAAQANAAQADAVSGDAQRARKDRVIVLAVERMEGFNWQSNPKVRDAIVRHINRAEGTADLLALVKQFQPQGFEPQVLRLAQQGADQSLAVDAVGYLLTTDKGRQLVEQSLAAEQPSPEVAGALGLLGTRDAIDLLRPLLTNDTVSFDARAAATRGLATTNLGGKALLRMAADGNLAADLRLLAGGILSRSNDEGLRTEAAKVLPLPTIPNRDPLPPVDQLASMSGSIEAGKQLFRNKATCANCHVVGDFGKEVGPNLSEIGDKLSREALFISILDPSAGISHNYENYICLLDSGQVVTGVLVSETEQAVTLRTAEAIDRKIDREQIEMLKKSDQSIMPQDLHHAFDTQGLVDVVEYLTTLKKR